MTGKSRGVPLFVWMFGWCAGCLFMAMLPHNHPSGLLVGYGCEKSDGKPVFFPEEDMFPSCSKIEEWKED